MSDLTREIFREWKDVEVVLLAIGLNEGLTVCGQPEAAGLAEQLNERLAALVRAELGRRELPGLSIQPHLRLLVGRAVQAIMDQDPTFARPQPGGGC